MAETGPWMPLYWADYLADTMHLTTEEHGAYLLLIGAYWRAGGPIPADDQYLSRATRSGRRWGKIKAAVTALFTIEISDVDFGVSDNRLMVHPENSDPVYQLRHKRIDFEILRSSDRLKSARANGRAGAQAKRKLFTTTVTEDTLADASVGRAPPDTPSVADETHKGSKVRKGSRLPDDWSPTEEHRRYARSKGLGYQETEIELSKFKAYYTEGPGRNRSWSNWDQALRNWLDKSERPAAAGQKPQRKVDAMMEGIFNAVSGSGPAAGRDACPPLAALPEPGLLPGALAGADRGLHRGAADVSAGGGWRSDEGLPPQDEVSADDF